jgi:hypothetical protein
MYAEWKVRFAVCIASVANQAFIKLLPTQLGFQETQKFERYLGES